MTASYKYLLLAIACWPVLPVFLIILYDVSGLRSTSPWVSFLFYAACFIPATAYFARYILAYNSRKMNGKNKIITTCYSLLMFVSFCMLLFAIAAPPGWD